MTKELFRSVDCASFYVSDLDAGLAFYRDALGLRLLWRAENSCGLGLNEGETELVLVRAHNPMVDFRVDSVPEALERFEKAGGTRVSGPFEIDIGLCAVVRDAWGNEYCILDMSKGKYTVEGAQNVTGVGPERAPA